MKNSAPEVLIAAPVHPVLIEGLESMGYECLMHESITQATAPSLIAGCSGVITSTRLQLDKALIDVAPLLKWIGRMGSGMEVIDLPYAAEKGIATFSSPEGNCNAVGEHAIGMLLALIRRVAVSNTEVKNGTWLRDENRGYELEGKTIGIIGYGHTGRSFAKKLTGFDVTILAYDKYAIQDAAPNVIVCETLDQIFERADIISFHVPLQPDTYYYFDDAFADSMKKPFILINTSRGRVVSTSALYNNVRSGKILGACLDVFEQEPISKLEPELLKMMSEMITLPNVLTTPHIAGYTFEALYKMSYTLLKKINAL